MAKRRPMSDAETVVARILWNLGNATARDVHTELINEGAKVDFTTVQTYLCRLEEKGYVTSKKEGRAKSYRAKVQPARVIRDAVDQFVDRLFAGDSLSLLQHLIEDEGISRKDIQRLRNVLDELEEKNK